MTNEFLQKLYAEKETDRALDLVFDFCDEVLDGHCFQSMDEFMVKHTGHALFGHVAENPNFAALDDVLRSVDLDRISDTVKLGFLSAPSSAKQHLKQYMPYLEKVRKHIAKRKGRRYAKKLTQNFER